tara:strand:+ start:1444 stop:3651 length:2208 start_codon:yes stop_codon:yes gene_type:complete
MIPTNSSGTTNGCDNISSNCVIWQGPDIACIDLCNGDSITEVTNKIALKVCDIITNGVVANPSLVGLDLSCLNIVGVTPTQLVPVLQAMVVQICANTGSSIPGGGGSTTLPTMTLPACLQYNDSNGNPVTQLPLDQFATLIANQVCTNLASINLINSTLTSYSTRLDVLEACVLPCGGAVAEVQIIPTCVSNVGTLTNVSVVVLALELAFCALRTAVGTVANINNAISQSAITGSSTTRSSISVSYGSKAGWNNSPQNLAESVQNAWVVIDDLYTAVGNIQLTCCPSGCASVIFAYTTAVSVDASTGLIDNVQFNFTTSTIPSAFNDAAGFSNMILTDALGSSLTQNFSVQSAQSNGAGISFATGALNTAQDMNVTVDFSVTDGADTCTSTLTSVITGVVPCPSVQTLSAITATGVSFAWSNTLGANASYVVDALDGSVVAETYTVPGTGGASLSQAFTNLTPNTPYNIRITVSYEGGTAVCALNAFTTQTAAAGSCSSGMDVAFVIDYTSTMGAVVDNIKAGVASISSTVNTQSGGTYRLGIITVDEFTNTTPTYNTSTDYLALPSGQRTINTGSGGKYQYITAWEMFQNNNATTFGTQMNKLNTGAPTAGVPLGQGSGNPDPTDMAIDLIMSSNYLGAFTAGVAKYIVVITDNLPGGEDDQFTSADFIKIQALKNFANTDGIKIFVLGAGTSKTYNNGGTIVYPWRILADGTTGAWSLGESATDISNIISNSC